MTDERFWRPASRQDLDSILALMGRYYAEDGYPLSEPVARVALERLLGDSRLGKVWVTATQDEPAGYAVLTVGYSLEYGGPDAFLDEIYLVPEQRGRGLAGRVLDLIERECVDRGVRALHLEVEREKVATQRLYRTWGFRDPERYLMTKMLTPVAQGREGTNTP